MKKKATKKVKEKATKETYASKKAMAKHEKGESKAMKKAEGEMPMMKKSGKLKMYRKGGKKC